MIQVIYKIIIFFFFDSFVFSFKTMNAGNVKAVRTFKRIS
jgi:hypothetical protein